MERAARQLLLFSFTCFVGVIAFAMVLGPAHKAVHSRDVARSIDLFHQHFDQLCWLGAAALGTALRHLAPRYAGPAWAPARLARAYALGSVTFAAAFVPRAIGQLTGAALLARVGFAALASIGGASLVAAAVSATAIIRALARGAPSASLPGSS